MTNEHDEPDPGPSTQQIPAIPPPVPDWRTLPITVHPVDETEEFGVTQSMPEPTPPTAPVAKLRKPPFKGVRFAFRDPQATATYYVNEGIKRDRDFCKKTRSLSVIKNGAVDTELISKLDFIPEDGEDEIRYLERRHWMYVGSVGIPHATLWLVASILYVSFGLDRYVGDFGFIVIGIWLAAWLIVVGVSWVRWYFVLILITNTRLHYIRSYPGINLTAHDLRLSAITDTEVTPLLIPLFGLDYARLSGSIMGGGESVRWFTDKGLRYLKHRRVLESITRSA